MCIVAKNEHFSFKILQKINRMFQQYFHVEFCKNGNRKTKRLMKVLRECP